MKLGKHQEAFMADVTLLLAEGHRLGYKCRGKELLRTPEMQAIHVKTGASKTMNSMHLKGCAIDLYWFEESGNMVFPPELGKFWESLSVENRYGGNFDKDWSKEDNFKDAPHYERKC